MHFFSGSIAAALLILALGAGFFLWGGEAPSPEAPLTEVKTVFYDLPPLPEPEAPTSSLLAAPPSKSPDAAKSAPLARPPEVVKGIYVTGWVAGTRERMKGLIAALERTELNAVVIDVKDYSGFLSYRTEIELAEKAGAHKQRRIAYPNQLLRDLHAKNVYVIGRVSVFQDPVLAKARPEWALKRPDGTLWTDRKGLAWLDPSVPEVWEYAAAIAKDAFDRGFDEVNFDYVRFPSDGALREIRYPRWDPSVPRSEVIREFFTYLDEELPDANISADLFGLAALAEDDLGIGQVLADAGRFDFVMPMVYPSHFATGFLGYRNPAEHPYEVIKYSMERAAEKLSAASSTAKLRPWLQAFDIGAVYDAKKIAAQIRGAEHALGDSGRYAGWVLWDPKNLYEDYVY